MSIKYQYIKLHKGAKFMLSALVIMFLLVVLGSINACIGDNPDPVIVQPPTAVANSNVTITLTPTINNSAFGPYTVNLIVAILVPKAWKAGNPGNTKVTYTSDIGNGTMIPMPSSITVPTSHANLKNLTYSDYFEQVYQAGNNFINDHEWLVYQTEKQYTLTVGQKVTPTITFTIKVGGQNMLTKFAYVVTYSGAGNDDPNSNDNKTIFSDDCFEVTGGTKPELDYCNKPIVNITPSQASDKDYISIAYDNDLKATPLQNQTSVFLNVTARVNDSTDIHPANKKFLVLGNQQYNFLMYPRAYFGLKPNQSLVRMSFFITDTTGTKVVGDGDVTLPFIYKFTTCP